LKRTFVVSILLIALIISACVTPQDEQTPATGSVIFSDDFSSSDSGWEVIELDAGSAGYGNGYYFVVGRQQGSNMYGAALQSFSDLIIEVDAAQVSSPENNNNSYGVICRLGSEDTGYYFFISGDGLYSLFVVGDEYSPLVDWTESPTIQQGEATNHILVGCVGDHLTMAVNAEPLIDVTDSTYTIGDVGLLATTYEAGTSTEIHYDDFVLRQP